RYGRTYMLQWVQDEWPWLEENFSDDPHFDMFPRYVASGALTEAHLKSYRDFFTPLLDNITLKRNIKLGITEIEGRVALIERDGPGVRQALIEL
ncbi:MAG: hypothetical protein WAQ27_01545, partial [Candidatus Microsaccharimonas sp.]